MPDLPPDDRFFEALASAGLPPQTSAGDEAWKDRLLSVLTNAVRDEEFFEALGDGYAEAPAPSRLKSKIYSALMQAQAAQGQLLSLGECKAHGRQLCVFEELVQITPLPGRAQAANYCRVCHARILGEGIEGAPIYWPGCPYVSFQNR